MIVNKKLREIEEAKTGSLVEREATGQGIDTVRPADIEDLIDRLTVLEDVLFSRRKLGYLPKDATLGEVIRTVNNIITYLNRDLRD
jgi:hypothetical protein